MTKAWKDNKDEIIKLYINEGRTLQDVMNIMREKHGFVASTRSYRQHFDHWRVGKYNCKRRQKRQQTYPQPNLPSPPGTPPMPLSQLVASEEASSPESASDAIHGNAARADTHYPPFLKQESLQAFGMQNLPLPYRNASGQQFIKAETPVAQAPQSKERPSPNMNCWNASDRPPAEWTQRPYFAKRDHMGPLGDISRYSPEEPSFNVNTGQISPTWHDHQSPMSDDMDWGMSKQRAPSHYVTMSPPLSQHQGQQLHEPDHKPMQLPAFHSGQASFVHGTARPQASSVNHPSVTNEQDRKPLQAPGFHSGQSSFVHSTTHPHSQHQNSVGDRASAALELRSKQSCIDRTAVHQAANFQLELA